MKTINWDDRNLSYVIISVYLEQWAFPQSNLLSI